MAWFSWSKTAATNATADSTINWAEGMAPSAVNDSARAMMARSAEWRDDISGTITTGGTSTAYTVASNQVFDTLAHMNGAMIAFVPNATNGATVTFNVDGLGAKPLRSAPGIELPAGTLISGTPYVAVYNNSDAVFYLRGYAMTPYLVPLGGLMPYLGSSAPNSNFVLPFGQAASRTTYATLFALTSTTFGVGDGSTTFNLPDLRGRFIAGLDNMGGSTASRITVAGGNFNGTTLGATGGAQNHTLTTTEMPSHTHANSLNDPGHRHNITVASVTSGSVSGIIAAGGNNVGTDIAAIQSATTGMTITNASAGSDGAHSILPPAMILPYILRVI